MKHRINITISENTLEKAKQIAKKRNSTVSALIESALNKLSKQESDKKSLSEFLKELPAPKNQYPKDFNFKEAYLQEKFKS